MPPPRATSPLGRARHPNTSAGTTTRWEPPGVSPQPRWGRRAAERPPRCAALLRCLPSPGKQTPSDASHPSQPVFHTSCRPPMCIPLPDSPSCAPSSSCTGEPHSSSLPGVSPAAPGHLGWFYPRGAGLLLSAGSSHQHRAI